MPTPWTNTSSPPSAACAAAIAVVAPGAWERSATTSRSGSNAVADLSSSRCSSLTSITATSAPAPMKPCTSAPPSVPAPATSTRAPWSPSQSVIASGGRGRGRGRGRRGLARGVHVERVHLPFADVRRMRDAPRQRGELPSRQVHGRAGHDEVDLALDHRGHLVLGMAVLLPGGLRLVAVVGDGELRGVHGRAPDPGTHL